MKTFSNNNTVYSVDMMLAYINIMKPKAIKMPISKYISKGVLNYEGWCDNDGNCYSPMQVIKNRTKYRDEMERIKSSDLKYPIVVDNDDMVVDGVHRLTKAYLEKSKYILVYKFPDEIMEKFIIGTNGDWESVSMMPIHELLELFYSSFC